jgi:putative membrane protein
MPKRDIAVFAIIFLSSIIVEIVGVKTGLVFGSYHYGNALGPKILGTPLIIGLNWLFLTYAAASISEKISSKTSIQILTTPTIMLVYDLVLEQLAPKMDMWHWENSFIPVQNYIAWWVLGFLFASLLKTFKVNTKNPVAPVLITVQFLFFLILFLL